MGCDINNTKKFASSNTIPSKPWDGHQQNQKVCFAKQDSIQTTGCDINKIKKFALSNTFFTMQFLKGIKNICMRHQQNQKVCFVNTIPSSPRDAIATKRFITLNRVRCPHKSRKVSKRQLASVRHQPFAPSFRRIKHQCQTVTDFASAINTWTSPNYIWIPGFT